MDHNEQSKMTLAVVKAMEEALSTNSNNMEKHFHKDFRWMGNNGCGTKKSLEEFRNNWQLPLRAAFSDRIYNTDKFLVDGEWASCFGHIDAIHSGEFMGIAPTNKRVKIHYTDFWEVKDGLIIDNWVTVDFPSILSQLDVDVFNGQGWEAYDRGEIAPAKPN
ncbi:ester cyclase [Candidatus Thioglobus sp.]|jgi:predicted ester cyclase|nr:ester cyclase [Candidatus Thioglobus sp.]MDB4025893.1 ester cyclase [Candidatus Thioglobus sp.]MDB4057735.1 ester cyclase [Candidatus Thioglobus sp.]MDB9863899.1 ester cyclase [Candidatus Thioglobus sp.]MDB9975406.1 ester cyclase [Candidatus Thioglobus sp.]|tara:strand:+ start:5333 stop:5818 length:486 start_codon:yes stop_codon:yes gene_type:complete